MAVGECKKLGSNPSRPGRTRILKGCIAGVEIKKKIGIHVITYLMRGTGPYNYMYMVQLTLSNSRSYLCLEMNEWMHNEGGFPSTADEVFLEAHN